MELKLMQVVVFPTPSNVLSLSTIIDPMSSADDARTLRIRSHSPEMIKTSSTPFISEIFDASSLWLTWGFDSKEMRINAVTGFLSFP